ncbi:hypothetical protein GCM10023189_13440 [Nibrella saemangeumensis]|uniref:Uncharacterized protein n=1 Tax=Nibrella saemangeumensis TaxID=1084526 RepID=A0ABP8MMZ1_9BACT
MKKILFFVLCAIAFLFLPSTKLLAQAEVENGHFEYDWSDVNIACDGRPIDVQIHNVVDWHVVTNKNKTIISASLRGTVTGVDQAGNTYKGFQHSLNTFQIPLPESGPISQHLRQMFHLVSQGSAPDLKVRYTFKVTVNANGELTVERESLSIDCN